MLSEGPTCSMRQEKLAPSFWPVADTMGVRILFFENQMNANRRGMVLN